MGFCLTKSIFTFNSSRSITPNFCYILLFISFQYVGASCNFLNQSLTLPHIFKFCNLENFHFIITLYLRCHFLHFWPIVNILKLFSPKKFIHAFWNCHLEVLDVSTTSMVTICKYYNLCFPYQSIKQNQCSLNYP